MNAKQQYQWAYHQIRMNYRLNRMGNSAYVVNTRIPDVKSRVPKSVYDAAIRSKVAHDYIK